MRVFGGRRVEDDGYWIVSLRMGYDDWEGIDGDRGYGKVGSEYGVDDCVML